MAGIHVFNRTKESHIGPNVFKIFRPNILANPYTDKPSKFDDVYKVSSRDEAISKYDHYFDLMYGSNTAFTKAVDDIYELYSNGVDVYLECYCAPLPCHGNIIAKKLRERLVREKLNR